MHNLVIFTRKYSDNDLDYYDEGTEGNWHCTDGRVKDSFTMKLPDAVVLINKAGAIFVICFNYSKCVVDTPFISLLIVRGSLFL